MPPPVDQPPHTWRLYFSTGSLDERIEMRGVLARLRDDPHVEQVDRTVVQGESLRGGELHTVQFRDGFDAPQARDLQSVESRYADWRRGANPEGLPTRVTPDHIPNRNGDLLTPEVRDRIISEYINSSEGRSRLAASMVAPLRQRLDYQATGRTFLVDQLPQGALPTYDRDPDVAGVLTRETLQQAAEELSRHTLQPGTILMSERDYQDLRAFGERVQFPQFEIASNPSIPLAEVRARRFDMVERDANGSPIPFEPPAWLRIPMWAYNEAQDWHVEVVAYEDGYVTVRNWRRQPETLVLSGSHFAENFKPCEQPEEPRARFDRLLEDDFLADLEPPPKKVHILIDGETKAWFLSKLKTLANVFSTPERTRFDHLE